MPSAFAFASSSSSPLSPLTKRPSTTFASGSSPVTPRRPKKRARITRDAPDLHESTLSQRGRIVFDYISLTPPNKSFALRFKTLKSSLYTSKLSSMAAPRVVSPSKKRKRQLSPSPSLGDEDETYAMPMSEPLFIPASPPMDHPAPGPSQATPPLFLTPVSSTSQLPDLVPSTRQKWTASPSPIDLTSLSPGPFFLTSTIAIPGRNRADRVWTDSPPPNSGSPLKFKITTPDDMASPTLVNAPQSLSLTSEKLATARSWPKSSSSSVIVIDSSPRPSPPRRIEVRKAQTTPRGRKPPSPDRDRTPIAQVMEEDSTTLTPLQSPSTAAELKGKQTTSKPRATAPRVSPLTCHHCRSRIGAPKMYCNNPQIQVKPTVKGGGVSQQPCNANFCDRCVAKHYSDKFMLGVRGWICYRCRDMCTCSTCRRKRDGENEDAHGHDGRGVVVEKKHDAGGRDFAESSIRKGKERAVRKRKKDWDAFDYLDHPEFGIEYVHPPVELDFTMVKEGKVRATLTDGTTVDLGSSRRRRIFIGADPISFFNSQSVRLPPTHPSRGPPPPSSGLRSYIGKRPPIFRKPIPHLRPHVPPNTPLELGACNPPAPIMTQDDGLCDGIRFLEDEAVQPVPHTPPTRSTPPSDAVQSAIDSLNSPDHHPHPNRTHPLKIILKLSGQGGRRSLLVKHVLRGPSEAREPAPSKRKRQKTPELTYPEDLPPGVGNSCPDPIVIQPDMDDVRPGSVPPSQPPTSASPTPLMMPILLPSQSSTRRPLTSALSPFSTSTRALFGSPVGIQSIFGSTTNAQSMFSPTNSAQNAFNSAMATDNMVVDFGGSNDPGYGGPTLPGDDSSTLYHSPAPVPTRSTFALRRNTHEVLFMAEETPSPDRLGPSENVAARPSAGDVAVDVGMHTSGSTSGSGSTEDMASEEFLIASSLMDVEGDLTFLSFPHE